MEKYKNIELNEELSCPLCAHDEYLLSSDGEKFTCASCGFHTNNLSAVKMLPQIKQLKTHAFIHMPSQQWH